ncbi:demethylmenaquinone methyltransferase [Leifsonia shinshuensis]|uniref:demethylmenaquinone methyltransferase n=1 Tax=Leifsonia shinshuensis TaxID=150026 RepID=UPI001F515579|nr:demethylmenaquinone methyltransferase [Leifsonia shinshuensis]MCI0157819.1 demethylmenaquinone methyltransferase [Leifsonia shinshuensis]
MSKADLSKQPAQVAAMFDEVSTHYDRTNTVLSMGNATLWRVATTRAVAPRAGETILDVAAGTGTSSASLARNGASVVAADFSQGMIEVGRQRQAANPFISFVQADATALPFDDDTFDAVTISFGLRNIVDPRAALAEFYRVTKPGGRVVVCEFSRPPLAPVRAGYAAYLRYGMPVLARVASSNPAAYEYLMESIEAWPSQPALAAWMREAGLERVAWRNLTAGIVALHRGWKPLTSHAPTPATTPETVTASETVTAPEATSAPAPKASATKPSATKRNASNASGSSARPSKPAAAKPAASKSTEGKPASKSAAKPAADRKPATPNPATPKPAASGKPAAAGNPAAAAKPAASAGKPSAGKPAAAKPRPRPAGDKPAATKSTDGKPADGRSARGTGSEDSSSAIPSEGE